jgi:hypothetical protein
MRPFWRLLSTAVVIGTAGALLTAPTASAGRTQTIRCVGNANFCGATVSIAGVATTRVVNVRLTDTDLKLVRVSVIPAASRRGVNITKPSYRLGGSQYRFTVNTARANRLGARIILIFSAGNAPSTAPGGNPPGTARSGTAIFSVGSGMTVSIVGGGAGTSNCTTSETNTTFVTKGDNESHSFGFDSKGSGSCFYERSWSYFKVAVKDAAGKQIGSGTMWFGQNETFGGYYANCRAPSGFDWVGVTCDDAHNQTVTIQRVGS